MTGKTILRKFKHDDIEQIHKIYSYYVKNSVVTFDIEAPSKEQIYEKYLAIEQKGHPIIVAELNNNIVGFTYASTYRPRPAYRFTCEDAIYVEKQMHGHGIGSLLMDCLIKEAKNFGFKQMVAIITSSAGPSIALHKKHGFSIKGEFPNVGYKFDKWHSIIHMQRQL